MDWRLERPASLRQSEGNRQWLEGNRRVKNGKVATNSIWRSTAVGRKLGRSAGAAPNKMNNEERKPPQGPPCSEGELSTALATVKSLRQKEGQTWSVFRLTKAYCVPLL